MEAFKPNEEPRRLPVIGFTNDTGTFATPTSLTASAG
jgi:hypothetical protein